jgi:ribose transport system substrate-binding protein
MKKVSIFLAMLLALCCCGCDSSGTELQVESKDVTIEVLVTSNSIFWDTVKLGVDDASQELGVNIVFEAPQSESDVDEQKQMLEDAINNGVDAIIISPLDANALNETLANATARGIPVLTIDNTSTYSGVKSAIGTQNENAGALAFENLAELMNKTGEIAIIKHSNSTVANDRVKGFQSKYSDYPDITVATTLEPNGDNDAIPDLVKQCLEENPNVKGFLTTSQSSTIALCKTIEELGRNDIMIVGFDAAEAEIGYLKDNILTGTMVQNPYLMGYLGIRNAYKVIEGESIDSIIDTGITYVNLLNMTEEDIEILLYPMGKENSTT